MDVKILGPNSLSVKPADQDEAVLIEKGLDRAVRVKRVLEWARTNPGETVGLGAAYYRLAKYSEDTGRELAKGHADIVSGDLKLAGEATHLFADTAEELRAEAQQYTALAGQIARIVGKLDQASGVPTEG